MLFSAFPNNYINKTEIRRLKYNYFNKGLQCSSINVFLPLPDLTPGKVNPKLQD